MPGRRWQILEGLAVVNPAVGAPDNFVLTVSVEQVAQR
jgi:hypothetical protein